MPATALANKIHPLCYEHHSEMRLTKFAENHAGMVYACHRRNCLVHYSVSEGYFLDIQGEVINEQCSTPPHRYCSRDRYPMYLSEVQWSIPAFASGDARSAALITGAGSLPKR
jgi:hypothetical protein